MSWLERRPWERAELPERVRAHPTMITLEERALLYLLAAERFDGRGALVDAGCFLGGSTIAFAEGLAANPRRLRGRPIHTYDLFVLDEVYKRDYPGMVADIAVGASFRGRFEELMAGRLDRVELHVGDILSQRWHGEAVKVLFIDIAKSWAVNDHVNREFLPALVAHESVVIHQDYVNPWLPWIHIGMEHLADAFEFAGSLRYGSALFVPTRAIGRDELPEVLRDELTDERKLELFDRAACRFEGEERGILELARGVLIAELGRPREAVAHVEEVSAAYATYDAVSAQAPGVSEFLRAQVAG